MAAAHGRDTLWSAIREFTTSEKVNLIDPVNNSNTSPEGTTQYFTWSEIEGSTGYLIQIDTTTLFSSGAVVEKIVSTPNATVSGLFNNLDYYWRVLSYHGLDSSNWSNTAHFNTHDIITSAFLETKNVLSVYPNPTFQTIFIRNLEGTNNILNIYSSTGELVRSEIVSDSTFEVDVSILSEGVYYLTVVNATGKQTSGTFVKK
jgi:hypothetical protein